jgi:prepilin-type N-terminal cleavage/methylation domain-containing protein
VKLLLAAKRDRRTGFTLAEVAVALVIVGYSLVFLLQALTAAKMVAAHTRNYKLSRELGVLTLGQIESGLYREDIENGLSGSYADQGYPEFSYEVVVGDESFHQLKEGGSFDNWKANEERLAEQRREAGEDEEDVEEQPFEKVKVRVTFPKILELSNELVIERWIPWTQVYGESEETEGGLPPAGSGSPQNSSQAPGKGGKSK